MEPFFIFQSISKLNEPPNFARPKIVPDRVKYLTLLSFLVLLNIHPRICVNSLQPNLKSYKDRFIISVYNLYFIFLLLNIKY